MAGHKRLSSTEKYLEYIKGRKGSEKESLGEL